MIDEMPLEKIEACSNPYSLHSLCKRDLCGSTMLEELTLDYVKSVHVESVPHESLELLLSVPMPLECWLYIKTKRNISIQ